MIQAYHKNTIQQNRYLPVVSLALNSGKLTELIPPEGIKLNTAVCRCRDVIRAFAQDDSILDLRLRDRLRERLSEKTLQVFIREGRAFIGDPKDKPSERPTIEARSDVKVEKIVLRAVSVLIAHGLMDSFEAVGYTIEEAIPLMVSGCTAYEINNTIILSI